MVTSSVGYSLGALLMNPPSGNGEQTKRHLTIAQELLGCKQTEIANLLAIATVSTSQVRSAGADWSAWEAARPTLESVIRNCDVLLIGWGVAVQGPDARRNFVRQVEWVFEMISRAGHNEYWRVGAQPRHPSLWHQFVSDRHGRTIGGTFSERIGQVIERVPVYGIGGPATARTFKSSADNNLDSALVARTCLTG